MRSCHLEQLKWLYDPSKKSKLKQSVEFTIRETGSLYYADDTIFTFVREPCLFDQEVSSNRTCISHFLLCKCVLELRLHQTSQTLRCSRSFPTPQLWQSLHGFRVSDGFCFGWFRRILTVFVFVGPVMAHAQIWYCRIWGGL